MDVNLNDDIDHIKNVVEACLLSASDYVTLKQLSNCFDGSLDELALEQVIFDIGQKYANSGVELIHLSGGYRFRTKLEYQTYINKLYKVKDARYSRSVLETLAIIAYKQPVTRGDIEDIRGVSLNSNAINILFDRGWIEVIGHKSVPGKPELLATTSQFLVDFGLGALEDLPELPRIEDGFSEKL